MDPSRTESRRGNTGDWFLEAVGKSTEPPPTPVQLPPPEPDAPDAETTATADEAEATPRAETTTELVGEMWRATGTQDPLEDWEPADLDRYVSRKRNFRWSVWVMGLVIIGAVVAAVLLSPRLVERQAASEAADYSEALGTLRGTLPASQQVLRVLTEPDTEADNLSDLVPDLSRLQAAADEVVDLAVRPLPQPLPLVPSDALDNLEPSRDAMGVLGSDATMLSVRLADGIAYRSLIEGFLDFGEVAANAPVAEISGIQERLALALADASAVLAELPGDPVFTEHRDALAAAVTAYRDWETNLIAALRNREVTTAQRLLDDHADLLEDLEQMLVPALAALRSEVDATILDLDRDLVETINELPT